MKKVFFLNKSLYHSGKIIICIHPELLPKHTMRGSYAVFESRLMMLTYPQYLRLCRDVYGAELYGKNSFPVPYFSDEKKAQLLVDELNKRINELLT